MNVPKDVKNTQTRKSLMKIKELASNRTLRIAANPILHPGSLFISIGTTACIEIDRHDFVASIMREFGLILAT